MKALHKLDIFARKNDHEIISTLSSLGELLVDYQVRWELETASLANFSDVKTVNYANLGQGADLIIVVGGDGSILRCVNASMRQQTPMIGINKGRLGFLTDIRPSDLDTRLLAVLQGDYWQAERFLLSTRIQYPNENTRDCGVALNDVILYPGETPHMLEFEIHVDDDFLCSHRADGLIVSTPTGSTAYNLSAGGPIVHPSLEALVLLPMFSHTLSSRPILIPSTKSIRIEFSAKNKIHGKLSSDAGEITDVIPGSEIFIQLASQKIPFVHPSDYDYYESLRSKLYWGQRLTD